jgi:hypothetical protein
MYATFFTGSVILLTSWAILASDRDDTAADVVTETITVTALSEPQTSAVDPHARLRRYLSAYDPYAVPRDCLLIRDVSSDLFDVVNECTPDREFLGRWHVDRTTGAVVRRRR